MDEYTDTGAEVGEGRTYYLKATANGSMSVLSAGVYGKRKPLPSPEPIYMNGAQYEQAGNGVKLVSFDSTDSNVVIPETVNGLPVIEISAGAFENNGILTSIDLPDTVELIGERAFAGCVNLSSMN